MTRSDKRTIENIIAVYPYIYGWQDELEREQEQVISDMLSPAKAVIAKLFEIDNKRIDLCNLKVLHEFIKREAGEGIARLFGQADAAPSDMYIKAARAIELAGYTLERARSEFGYLFKRIKKKPTTMKNSKRVELEYLLSASAQ